MLDVVGCKALYNTKLDLFGYAFGKYQIVLCAGVRGSEARLMRWLSLSKPRYREVVSTGSTTGVGLSVATEWWFKQAQPPRGFRLLPNGGFDRLNHRSGATML
jgi:hypothetical protein